MSRGVLALAIGVGLLVRLLRVAEWPLLHPDGPAYVALARAVRAHEWATVLGGYYSPLYPLTIAPLASCGVPVELAARLIATLAGVAMLPALFGLARWIGGDRVAAIAVLVAAVHPALVKASAQVLPETLAGAFVAGSVALLASGRDMACLGAGACAGLAYLARPEGAVLLPLGVAWLAWRRRPAAAATFALAATLVAAPAVLALHARTGGWELSGREAVIAARVGAGQEPSLVVAALHRPGALLAQWASGLGEQTWNTLVALGPVAGVSLLIGLRTLRPAWPLAIALAFVAGPLALNPSPRYAVPILPLLLPWTAAGLVALAPRLGGRAPIAFVAALLILAGQALWVSKPFDDACVREVASTIRSRWGPGQTVVAIDGRIAYLAHATPAIPDTTGPAAALALARTRHARAWVTRPQWLGPSFRPPDDVHEVARPCGGAFVLFEIRAP